MLSDTHVAADRTTTNRGVNMRDNLNRAVEQLVARSPQLDATFINGDCAFRRGEKDDYRALIEALAPARQVGLPIYSTLGNHDHRDHFLAAVAPKKVDDDANAPIDSAEPLAKDRADPDTAVAPSIQVQGKCVSVVETPLANWFLLDSLWMPHRRTGQLGGPQLEWLARELDARPDRPAVVLMHHHPDPVVRLMGLSDTAALYQVLVPRKQVKALIFGHTHHWGIGHHEGIHLINLPPVAYVFVAGKPNGWVEVQLAGDGMRLTLNCLDARHVAHQQSEKLTWRS